MIPAVGRAFSILDLLSRSPQPLGASEVARRLRIPKSTAHGLLRSLQQLGAVEASQKRYRLGPTVDRLAAAAELRRHWRAGLERLARETGQTAFLGQPGAGGRVTILEEVVGDGPLIVSAPIGSRLPAGAGAVGRVLGGERVAVDQGEYLEGVNAVAAAVPGGVLWVAGFSGRLSGARLDQARRLLEEVAWG